MVELNLLYNFVLGDFITFEIFEHLLKTIFLIFVMHVFPLFDLFLELPILVCYRLRKIRKGHDHGPDPFELLNDVTKPTNSLFLGNFPEDFVH